MSSRNKQPGVAQPKSLSKANRFDGVVTGLVVYMEVAKGARAVLTKEQVITQGIDNRLQIEANFCMNLLVNICKLSPGYIHNLQNDVHGDKVRFEKEVESFCEAILPKEKRRRIQIPKNAQQELNALLGKNKGTKKQGRIII